MNEAQEPSKTDDGQSRLTVGLERDSARSVFYKGTDRGEPMHWRDIGPDEVWNEAWQAASAFEREACAKACEEYAQKNITKFGPDYEETAKSESWAILQAAHFIRQRSNVRL